MRADDYIAINEAEKIIKKEKNESKYMLFQKFLGVTMLAIGIVCPCVFKDVTFSILSIPIGIGLLVTKKSVIDMGE